MYKPRFNENYNPALAAATGYDSYRLESLARLGFDPSESGPWEVYNPPDSLALARLAESVQSAIDNRALFREDSRRAYAAFIAELDSQYRAILDAGRITINYVDYNPYKNSAALLADVTEFGRIRILKTDAEFGNGESENDNNHPLLASAPFYAGNEFYPCWNDVFRAVHDLWAHCIGGFQFGPAGEYNAALVHLSCFYTNSARRVLLSETLAQNSWFNYGPHLVRGVHNDGIRQWARFPGRGEDDYIPPAARPFTPQLTAVYPWSEFDGIYLASGPRWKGRQIDGNPGWLAAWL